MCRYTSLPFYRVFGLRSAVWLSQPVSIAYQVLIIKLLPLAFWWKTFQGLWTTLKDSSIDCRVLPDCTTLLTFWLHRRDLVEFGSFEADHAGHDECRLRHFRRSLVLGMQHLRIGHRSQLGLQTFSELFGIIVTRALMIPSCASAQRFQQLRLPL